MWPCPSSRILTATTLCPGSCSLSLVCVTLCIPLWNNFYFLTFPSIVFLAAAGLCWSQSGRICRLWIHCPLLLAGRIWYQEHPTGQLHPKGTTARTYTVKSCLGLWGITVQCQAWENVLLCTETGFCFCAARLTWEASHYQSCPLIIWHWFGQAVTLDKKKNQEHRREGNVTRHCQHDPAGVLLSHCHLELLMPGIWGREGDTLLNPWSWFPWERS